MIPATIRLELDFGRDELKLSVSDAGVGLFHDYGERGHGFESIRTYAERLGGRLIVEPRAPDGGARVTCVSVAGPGGGLWRKGPHFEAYSSCATTQYHR